MMWRAALAYLFCSVLILLYILICSHWKISLFPRPIMQTGYVRCNIVLTAWCFRGGEATHKWLKEAFSHLFCHLPSQKPWVNSCYLSTSCYKQPHLELFPSGIFFFANQTVYFPITSLYFNSLV